MATKPSTGDTNWGTTLNANIDVGHDSDGTHKKSQMLTDMEWSPTAYAGGESITFPNGLIIKTGEVTTGDNDGTVTFGTAFPTAIVSVQLTPIFTSDPSTAPTYESPATTGFDWHMPTNATGFSWTATGY